MKHRPLLFTALALTAATALTGPATTATAAPSPSAEAPKDQGAPAPADRAGLRIIKTDPEGQPASGAAFQLLDPAGKTLAEGKTGSDGTLAFSDLAPGEPKVLAITNPYKPAGLTLKVTDKATGKGLAGVIVNIAPKDAKDDKGAFTLTTGPDGTAKAPIPVGKKTGSAYTATETKAPDAYRLETTPVEITAKPGAETTAVFTNAATTKPPRNRPASRRPSPPATPPSSPRRPPRPRPVPGSPRPPHPLPVARALGPRPRPPQHPTTSPKAPSPTQAPTAPTGGSLYPAASCLPQEQARSTPHAAARTTTARPAPGSTGAPTTDTPARSPAPGT